jgi:hypothetical protein
MGQDNIAVKHGPVKIFRVANPFVSVISYDANHIGVEVVMGKVT